MKDTAREFRAAIVRIEYVGRRYAIIEAQASPDFVHSPGQFTKVAFTDPEGTFERYYSIASASHGDGRFELCLILDDQRTRQLVAGWTPGSTFICSEPAGRFTIPPKQSPVVCIAGGSGIITGNFSVEESTQLAVLLRAGALPAKMNFLEERTGLTFASLRDTVSQAELRAQAGPVLVTDVDQIGW